MSEMKKGELSEAKPVEAKDIEQEKSDKKNMELDAEQVV